MDGWKVSEIGGGVQSAGHCDNVMIILEIANNSPINETHKQNHVDVPVNMRNTPRNFSLQFIGPNERSLIESLNENSGATSIELWRLQRFFQTRSSDRRLPFEVFYFESPIPSLHRQFIDWSH